MPRWAKDLVTSYESGAANQFVLHGNVADRILIPTVSGEEVGDLSDFLLKVLLPRFDVVLTYDLGNGIRIEKGNKVFADWPALKDTPILPNSPRPAIEAMTRYFRYTANLSRLGRGGVQVGAIIRAASLVAPASAGWSDYDRSAISLLIREWGTESLLTQHALATFILTESLNDLHPLIAANSRSAKVLVPLPPAEDLSRVLRLWSQRFPKALSGFSSNLDEPASMLSGATLASVESLLKTTEHQAKPLTHDDLASLKKQLVESDCGGLIEFIEPDRSLDDVHAQDKLKAWLRQDIALWRAGDLNAMPMGYLLCGPVGTGKTYMVECLAGDAGVPVVKLKNFRDKWVGSTESNLEKIFRLLHALGRCIVFIDEADQALGKRDAGSGDSGVSGRVYSMIAEEMSDTRNRGKILWVLASSRPDLIEVDLKRPGRIDVKIPLFPSTSPEEGFSLIRALCNRRGVMIASGDFDSFRDLVPSLITPGAAEALSVKIYRTMKTEKLAPRDALRACLTDYRHPVPEEVMQFQIGLAVREASDLDFVPIPLRNVPSNQSRSLPTTN